jgi:hypothetical protein
MSVLLNGLVTRNRINDRYTRSGHPFDQCPTAPLDRISSISGYHYYLEHFETYEGPAGNTGNTITDGWLLGDTNTAVIAIDAAAQFGALNMATAGAENDSVFLMRPGGQWAYTAGKRLWCFAKFNLTDANDMDAYFGLRADATTEAAIDTIAENIAVANGVFFEKAETATQFDFHTRNTSVGTEDTLVTSAFSDSVDRMIGFTVDTAGAIHAWDGTTFDNLTEVATRAVGVSSIPTANLSLCFGFENGAGADAENMTVDWLFVAQER